MPRYSHRQLYELARAVEKLPSLVPNAGPNANPTEARHSGTDDALDAIRPLGPVEHLKSGQRCLFGRTTGGIQPCDDQSSEGHIPDPDLASILAA
jgi:hypothetical protein